MKLFNKLVLYIFILLLLTSCAKNIIPEQEISDEQINNNNDNAEKTLLLSYSIPDGYVKSYTDESSGSSYITKEDDTDLELGFISCTSMNKIDGSIDDLIARYEGYFDSEDAVLKYTSESFANVNGIQCILFSLITTDGFDRICYVLTNSRDLCVEAIYYDENSELIKAQDYIVNSVVDNADENYKFYNSTAVIVSESLVAGGIEENDNWYCRGDFEDVSSTWYIPHDQFLYFSNITNGYTQMEVLIASTYEEYQNILSSNLIEPGDLAFFSNKGSEYMQYSCLVTGKDDKGLYLTCSTKSETILNNSYLDEATFSSLDVYFIIMKY